MNETLEKSLVMNNSLIKPPVIITSENSMLISLAKIARDFGSIVSRRIIAREKSALFPCIYSARNNGIKK